MKFGAFAVLLAFLAGGCQSFTAQSEVNAMLTKADGQVHEELVAVISRLSGVFKVLIGDDAFTTSSYLALDGAKLKEPSGLLMQGMETEEPNVFRLVKTGDACYLVFLKTGQHAPLAKAQCLAKKACQ